MENNNTISNAKKPREYSRSAILTVSAFSYILFFLPFIFCRNEPFAKYHLNQALVLWIFVIPLYLIFAFIPDINIYVLPVISLFHIFAIMVGISNVIRSKARPLPIIGRIIIIKWEQ